MPTTTIESELTHSNEQQKTDWPVEKRCRVCSCTEDDACLGGCAWMPGEGALCTTCGDLVRHALIWKATARSPNFTALVREIKRVFAALEKAKRESRKRAMKGGAQ